MRLGGCLLLLGATLYLALTLSAEQKRRLALSEGMLLLLHHISANLSCFSLPLSAVFASFCHEGLEKTGFLKDLRRDGLLSALQKHKRSLSPSKEEWEILLAFAQRLGKGFLAEEEALCRYTTERYEALFKRLEEEGPRKRKTQEALVITGGLMVILLFL